MRGFSWAYPHFSAALLWASTYLAQWSFYAFAVDRPCASYLRHEILLTSYLGSGKIQPRCAKMSVSQYIYQSCCILYSFGFKCLYTSGGILALASTRDFLKHSFHFRPPMYWEYIVYSQYMGGLKWKPCYKKSRALASARVPPLLDNHLVLLIYCIFWPHFGPTIEILFKLN